MYFPNPYSVVSYSADSTGCLGDDGDDDGGICRCSQIESVTVQDVNLTALCTYFVPETWVTRSRDGWHDRITDDLLNYIAGRIAVVQRVFDNDYWYFDTERGYYGQEVGGAHLENSSYQAVMNNFVTNATTPDGQQTALVATLEAEYGPLLPELEGATYTVATVSRRDLIIGRPDYLADLTIASGYHEPLGKDVALCLALAVPGGYRLIDGYHRVANFDKAFAALPPTKHPRRAPKIKIIVATPPTPG
jgi:hypothetical protein